MNLNRLISKSIQTISMATLTVFAVQALAPSANAEGGKGSGSSSGGSTAPKNAFAQFTGGAGFIDQTMASEYTKHPLGYRVSGHYKLSFLHVGFGVMSVTQQDSTNIIATSTKTEQSFTETFALNTFDAGFVISDWLIIDAGYGLATFNHSDGYPYAAPVSSNSYSASGTGSIAGLTIIPFHIAGKFSLGISGYYFDATATDYSSDLIANSTETTKTSGNGPVHTWGYMGGITFLAGI